jgi:hypothetical protein
MNDNTRLSSPIASVAAAGCKMGQFNKGDIFSDFIARVGLDDPIYDSIIIPRGDLSSAVVLAAMETANGYPAGTISWDATEKFIAIPLFRYHRYTSGVTAPARGLDETNIYGGTFGSIHNETGHGGVATSRNNLPAGGEAWTAEYLASHMAVDAYSNDDGALLLTDVNSIQKGTLEQDYLIGGRTVADSPTHCALVSCFPGIFRAHAGDSDGAAAAKTSGGASLQSPSGLKPRKLDRGALVVLHDDSVKAPETRAYLTLRIPFFRKATSGSVLANVTGFDSIDDGTNALPAVANAVQPGVVIRVTLFPDRTVSSSDPGARSKFGPQAPMMLTK